MTATSPPSIGSNQHVATDARAERCPRRRRWFGLDLAGVRVVDGLTCSIAHPTAFTVAERIGLPVGTRLMKGRRTLNRLDVEKEPFRVWNAFIEVIATEEYEDRSPTQRLAQLAFWYDSEVHNGGHLQYFVNSAGARRHEAVIALRSLGLSELAKVLAAAIGQWEAIDRDKPTTTDEFVEDALEGEFDDADSDYHACKPTITDALRIYLDSHLDEFVVVL